MKIDLKIIKTKYQLEKEFISEAKIVKWPLQLLFKKIKEEMDIIQTSLMDNGLSWMKCIKTLLYKYKS